MSNIAPDAEQIERNRDDPRWHTTGYGRFALRTAAWITRDGGVCQYHCVHRFRTVEARDEYRKVTEQFGIFESASEDAQ